MVYHIIIHEWMTIATCSLIVHSWQALLMHMQVKCWAKYTIPDSKKANDEISVHKQRQIVLGDGQYCPPLSEQALQRHDLVTSCELRQFRCPECYHPWWKTVPKYKPVSRCYECRLCLNPLSRVQQFGTGRFTCKCGNVFYSKCQGSDSRPCRDCGRIVRRPYIHPNFRVEGIRSWQYQSSDKPQQQYPSMNERTTASYAGYYHYNPFQHHGYYYAGPQNGMWDHPYDLPQPRRRRNTTLGDFICVTQNVTLAPQTIVNISHCSASNTHTSSLVSQPLRGGIQPMTCVPTQGCSPTLTPTSGLGYLHTPDQPTLDYIPNQTTIIPPSVPAAVVQTSDKNSPLLPSSDGIPDPLIVQPKEHDLSADSQKTSNFEPVVANPGENNTDTTLLSDCLMTQAKSSQNVNTTTECSQPDKTSETIDKMTALSLSGLPAPESTPSADQQLTSATTDTLACTKDSDSSTVDYVPSETTPIQSSQSPKLIQCHVVSDTMEEKGPLSCRQEIQVDVSNGDSHKLSVNITCSSTPSKTSVCLPGNENHANSTSILLRSEYAESLPQTSGSSHSEDNTGSMKVTATMPCLSIGAEPVIETNIQATASNSSSSQSNTSHPLSTGYQTQIPTPEQVALSQVFQPQALSTKDTQFTTKELPSLAPAANTDGQSFSTSGLLPERQKQSFRRDPRDLPYSQVSTPHDCTGSTQSSIAPQYYDCGAISRIKPHHRAYRTRPQMPQYDFEESEEGRDFVE